MAADTIGECAERALFLSTHSEQAEEVARLGRTQIRERFLTPRLLRDELRLIRSLVEKKASILLPPGSTSEPAASPSASQ